ncbi:unnamed protein product [Prorocentrum cordatum]|uniref:ubiquitinyl hydrolase 1 n=1 Tax=Prorocentrum cordatum TaxID=2364126 RepID=A0ABN9X9G5_9DINO|nr:unnamed protein product [Polarella glacialis]
MDVRAVGNNGDASPQSRHEQQRFEECGLCALRNVLKPHGGGELPTWALLQQDAREIEEGEDALLTEVECCRQVYRRCDSGGNFGVEVLMRAAARRQVNGNSLLLEYWGGRHREDSHGRELGFILGSGKHWWCVRRCSKGSRWEEVDSLEHDASSKWGTDEELRAHLADSGDTVLVLYPAAAPPAR